MYFVCPILVLDHISHNLFLPYFYNSFFYFTSFSLCASPYFLHSLYISISFMHKTQWQVYVCVCGTCVCLCEAENMLMPFRITEKTISLALCSQLHTKWYYKLILYSSASFQQWLDRYLISVLKNGSSTDIPPHPAKKIKKERRKYRLGIAKLKLKCTVRSNSWNQWSKTWCSKHFLQFYAEPPNPLDLCAPSRSILGCLLSPIHLIIFV